MAGHSGIASVSFRTQSRYRHAQASVRIQRRKVTRKSIINQSLRPDAANFLNCFNMLLICVRILTAQAAI
ncbi:hypothetical protein D9X30_0194 [Cupriavidus sp. U2]|nr:hypothetical protein D9X30_0194 [Cupriavidus sp. U2]